MRKVFTYSRKKPFSNVKSSISDENSKENYEKLEESKKRSFQEDSHSKLISSIISKSTDSSGNTPQTKRHKDIKNLLNRIDNKLNFLALNEKIDFQKFYRHKNIILSEIRNTSECAKLSDLLELIRQESAYKFDDWFSNKLENMKYSSKLGEATFSEVFKFEMKNGENEVVKIIPLDLENPKNSIIEVDIYPLPININAAIHECTVLNEISSLKEHRKNSSPPHFTGFNNNIEMCVVKGKYPNPLIRNWIKWDKDRNSENSNPDRYDDEQHFLIISMEDGGVDLERYKFKNMKEIESVLVQLIHALALAEEKIQFEHRDLHLGNILVKSTSVENFYHQNDLFEFNGIKCNIIDYSLSRMSDSAGVAFRDLDTIEWLFEGDPSFDSQYQVYKDMRSCKGQSSWQDFHPRTNILWLNFIFERLIQKQKKSIQKPKDVFSRLKNLHKNILKYSSVQELKEKDEFFNK